MDIVQNSSKFSNNEKQHVCETCGKSFKSKYYLIAHKTTHSGENFYECNSCDKNFIRNDILKWHQYTHSRLKIYQCDVVKDVLHEEVI